MIKKKIPNKRQLREGFVFAGSWRIQSVKVRKSWQQDLEAAGHIASSGGKQREVNAGTQLTLFSSETIAGGMVPSALDLPASINVTQKNPSQKKTRQRFVSMMVLNSIKMTIKSSHHTY